MLREKERGTYAHACVCVKGDTFFGIVSPNICINIPLASLNAPLHFIRVKSVYAYVCDRQSSEYERLLTVCVCVCVWLCKYVSMHSSQEKVPSSSGRVSRALCT